MTLRQLELFVAVVETGSFFARSGEGLSDSVNCESTYSSPGR